MEEKQFTKINDIEEYVAWTENTCAKLDTPLTDIVHMLFGMKDRKSVV